MFALRATEGREAAYFKRSVKSLLEAEADKTEEMADTLDDASGCLVPRNTITMAERTSNASSESLEII